MGQQLIQQVTFDTLPAEIIHLIVDQLAALGDHWSLLDLACTSRVLTPFCIDDAKSVYFRKISIETAQFPSRAVKSTGRKLQEQIDPLVKRLTQASSFQHVRHLTIKHLDEEPDQTQWEPLAQFILCLPALKEITWNTRTQFPPCVLDVLEQEKPHCGVHLITSCFLLLMKNDLVNRYEVRLLQSQVLRTVRIVWTADGINNSSPFARRQIDTIHWLLRGAPNLRSVHLYRRWSFRDTFHAPADAVEVPVPQGDMGGCKEEGSLRRLYIEHDKSMLTADQLFAWQSVVDFSQLRKLDICTVPMTEALTSWTQALEFPNLTSLRLDLTPRVSLPHPPMDFYCAAQRFILGLPALATLHLKGWHSLISVPALVKRHGGKLHKLVLQSYTWQCLTKQDLCKIREHCSFLEHLVITLPRLQGSIEEVELYKELGRIPRLTHLDLTLDVSDSSLYGEEDRPPIDPSFDEFDRQPYEPGLRAYQPALNGHLRKLMINTAIDKNLAQAIFQTIATAKPAESWPLERMKILVTGSGKSDPPGSIDTDAFRTLVRRFTSEWSLHRDRRHTNRGAIQASEITSSSIVTRRTQHLSASAEIVFYRVWPKHQSQKRKVSKKLQSKRNVERAMNTSVWWKHWESFPLAKVP